MKPSSMVTVTYHMYKGDCPTETTIDLPMNLAIAMVLRREIVEVGYRQYRAKVYTVVNLLAHLQGYDRAEIVKIRYSTKSEVRT